MTDAAPVQGGGAWAPKVRSSRRGARPPCTTQRAQATAAGVASGEYPAGGCSGGEPRDQGDEEAEGHSHEGELDGHSGLRADSRGSDCGQQQAAVGVSGQVTQHSGDGPTVEITPTSCICIVRNRSSTLIVCTAESAPLSLCSLGLFNLPC